MEQPWPMGLSVVLLAGVTLLVALTSEIFVESVQQAASDLGMSQAFVGFVVVALVGGAAEMTAAFSGARKNRLDLSVGIALGSAAPIALFVPPAMVLVGCVIGPMPMDLILARCGGDDGVRHARRGAREQRAALGMVHRRPADQRIPDIRNHAVSLATRAQ